MTQNQFPTNWDEQRAQRVLAYYEAQTEDEAVLEDETAFEEQSATFMEIPEDLLPTVRESIAKYQANKEIRIR